MTDAIREAGKLKDAAMLQRDLGDNAGALELLQQAEETLEQELNTLTSASVEDQGGYEKSVRKQLYNIRGTRGGVLRRDGQYIESAKAYDRGYAEERHFPDSYNLTQRLVSRVLAEPRSVEVEDHVVADEKVRAALESARVEIEGQLSKRGSDEYALADLLMIAVLLGASDWIDRLRSFATAVTSSSYARQVTKTVFEEIVEQAQAAGASELAGRAKRAVEIL